MKRGATCVYGFPGQECNVTADRTVNQKPYCFKHATIVENIRRSIDNNRPLLDRLAEDD